MLIRLGFLRRITPLVVCVVPVSGLVSVCRNSARMLPRRAYADAARSMISSALCARAEIGSAINAIATRQVSFFIDRLTLRRLCRSGFRGRNAAANGGSHGA